MLLFILVIKLHGDFKALLYEAYTAKKKNGDHFAKLERGYNAYLPMVFHIQFWFED